MTKIDSVYDFSPKALVEVKSWLEPWFKAKDSNCACVQVPTGGNWADMVLAIPDLRGYWRLGEGASPYADTSGYNPSNPGDVAINTGTVGSSPIDPDVPGLLPMGQDDGAVAFTQDGSASEPVRPFLQDGDNSSRVNFDFGSGNPHMSAVARVKTYAAAASYWGTVVSVTRFVTGSSGLTDGWMLQVSFPDGKVRFWRGNTTTTVTTATSAAGLISFGQEYTLGASYDGATIRVYLDGVVVASAADTTNIPAVATLTSLNIAGSFLWQSSVSSTWQPFFGVIDEVAVWGQTLTAAQMAGLHATAAHSVPVGSVLTSGGDESTSWTVPVTVQAGPPGGTFSTPFVFDSTATTGGLYGWDGAAYQQVGPPL